MARPPRLVVPDVALHVVQRGVNRESCFREEADYLVYLTYLRDQLPASGCALHAYCLMTNHVHLLLTPRDPDSCARLMRGLGRHYVPYFNKRHGRTGTLWEGRFRSCLVDSARYVLACYRYIELNPVRAAMVAAAGEYRWSSHAGNAGRVHNRLLEPHAEYLALASEAARHAAYRQLFTESDELSFLEAVRNATNGGYALADARRKLELRGQGRERLERARPGPREGAGETIPITADLGFEL
jgi:putative transposase